jgi:hypothetical protein
MARRAAALAASALLYLASAPKRHRRRQPRTVEVFSVPPLDDSGRPGLNWLDPSDDEIPE